MTSDQAEELQGSSVNELLTADLTPEQQTELEARHVLAVGDEVVWIEPDGRVRREKLTSLYYIRTRRGVYRVSRISKEIVEV
jgi:hypothetical protein